jgi:hypothetical protein
MHVKKKMKTDLFKEKETTKMIWSFFAHLGKRTNPSICIRNCLIYYGSPE